MPYRDDAACFEIQGVALWEPEDGRNAEIIWDIATRSRITIGGMTFAGAQLQWLNPLVAAPILSTVAPDDPQTTPSIAGFAGFMQSCLYELYPRDRPGPDLAFGLHLATVETTTTSGVVHTYAWAFRVP